MTHAPLRSFCATTAICAVLALGSTPAWAQEASAPVSEAPAITLPAPAPAAQPTIVLPVAPAASTAAPVVQQVPAAAPAATVADEPAPERSTKPRAAKTAVPAAARSVSAARTAAPETPPATPIAAPAQRAADAMPPVAAPPLAQPAVTQPPVAAVSPTESDTSTGLSTAAWIAGILAALGIGTAGVLALRSRRRDEEEDYEEAYYEDAHAADPARFYDEPGPMMAPAMAASEPSVLEPELPMPAYAPAEEMAAEAAPKAIEPTPHPSVIQRIGTEELVPDNREDRDALLEQMVSAEPDAENPFTSRKGRMRRARLILQGREHEQKEAEVQPFDWRTYQSSTSNPAPATPPRVTV